MGTDDNQVCLWCMHHERSKPKVQRIDDAAHELCGHARLNSLVGVIRISVDEPCRQVEDECIDTAVGEEDMRH